MITKYLTTVSVAFNPFSKAGRTARIFMTLLGPDARNTMKIKTAVLRRDSEVGGRVEVGFSIFPFLLIFHMGANWEGVG